MLQKYEKGLFTIWGKDKLFWSSTFTDQVIEQDLMLSAKSEGCAKKVAPLFSCYSCNALRDLTDVKRGTRSEQYGDMRLSQRKEGYRHLSNFIDFLEIHNLFKTSSSDLLNIATGTITSSDVNADSSIDIGKGILQKLVNKHCPKSHSNIRNYVENCKS